ncbi:MAG TPA: hypothetical protein VGO11_21770 [Chthoniobacteraceae bacterium]|jgi:hypothetical protein|nr:hypothetical protein [Chthoniobacteraceae bacterium]
MSWSLDKANKVWKCSRYDDLNPGSINNLVEYGQPVGPYERGFDQDFDPDFGNVIVEMSQAEVMNSGYGRMITPTCFPIVQLFLQGAGNIPAGSYDFAGLHRFGLTSSRRINTDLYGDNTYGITSGTIDASSAAYVHGTVGFALMRGTRFLVAQHLRRVEAEIGALDDNWDLESGNWLVNRVNFLVAVLIAPDNYNLTAPIQIRYRGPGRRLTDRAQVPVSSGWSRYLPFWP